MQPESDVRIVDRVTRALTLVALAVVVVYPVRGFLALSALPTGVRLLWPALAVAAAVAPRASLLGFLLVVPLLPILPRELGWPAVTLGQLWLFALLLPAWIRVVLGRGGSAAAPPAGAPSLLILATVSLAVTLYPFHLPRDGLFQLVRELHQFAATDFVVLRSQAHVYSPILAWALVAEGLALLWLVLFTFGGAPHARLVEPVRVAALSASLVAAYGFCSGGPAATSSSSGCGRILESRESTRPSRTSTALARISR